MGGTKHQKILDITTSIEKMIEEGTKNHERATKMVATTKKKLTNAKRLGIDVTGPNDLLKKAEFILENAEEMQEYGKALKYAKIANKAIRKLLDQYKQTKKLMLIVKAKISELEKDDVNISKPRGLFEKVESAVKSKDYETAMDLATQAQLDLERVATEHKSLIKLLSRARLELEAAKETDANISEALKLFERVETFKNEGEYTKAIKTTKKTILTVKKLKETYLQASELIESAATKLNEAKSIEADISKAEELYNEATSLMVKDDYEAVINVANESIEASGTAISNIKAQNIFIQAQEALEKAHVMINEYKKFIDTSNAEQLFETAEGEMEAENHAKVLELANNAITEMEDIKSNNIPIITVKFQKTPVFKSGEWAKCQLDISNASKVHADVINLQISDEVESRGLAALNKLKAGDTQAMKIGLRVAEIGDIPININLTYLNPITDKPQESQEVLWVKTKPGKPGAKPKLEAAPREPPAKAEPGGEVEVLSALEFFQGYIRLKVGIKNNQDTVITDAKLDLEFDNKAINFDHIEPKLERIGNKIIFGVIHPKVKKTIAIYLDPLICTESFIDGTLTFKDIWGKLRTSGMKRRKAEIVCPIFYTPENINTAMLKRLINEELAIHDNKIYEIPAGLDYNKASEVCKDTIQGHDLKFVREFIERDVDDPEIESWFYGKTKVKQNEVVIKASSRKKTNTIELFVACKSKQVLTGFLAELGHNLSTKLKELGVIERPIYPITNNTIRMEIAQTSSLLHSRYLDKAVLSLSKRGDEYEVGFKTSEETGEASEVFEFIKVSPDTRKDLLTQVEQMVTISNIFLCTDDKDGDPGDEAINGDSTRKSDQKDVATDFKLGLKEKIQNLPSLGELLCGMFLPVSIQKYLKTLNEPLILKTNDNEIPWELLHDGKEFICLKTPLGRKLRTREVARVNTIDQSDKIRFLFIVNTTGDLESAENEVNYIKSNLGAEIDIEILEREDATNTIILSALRSGKYDIIHYAGHAVFNVNSPDESAILTANNGKIFAQEIKRVLGGKPFVFLNACSTSKEKICEDGQSYTGSDTEGLASSFILGGALAFIGASWPMPDLSAGILASDFYKYFLSGETVGEALRKARIDFKTKRPDDINWMAFTLYGDPTLSLAKNIST